MQFVHLIEILAFYMDVLSVFVYNYAMLDGVSVIAFDIDGTLYPTHSLNIRIWFYVLRHLRFFLHYSKVRKIMHRTAPLADFYGYQARLLAEELSCSVEVARAKIQQIIYDGMKPYFTRIKPFRGMQEAIAAFKAAGYRIALLSDFPPEQKGELWGIIPYCELILGSEDLGALKPSKYPFGVMALALNVPIQNILYVGNSIRYDVKGAKNAGMKCAYLLPLWRRLLRRPLKEADICFSNYRQLQEIVIH